MRFALLVGLAAAVLSAGEPSEAERAVFAAAGTGDAGAVRQLLQQGAPANARDERARTPLHAAAAAGSAETVRVLVTAGADVNARERSGWTPLMDAVKAGRLAAAEALLAAGADPDARDRAAGTVLDVAQKAGQDGLVALLRRHGAKGGGKSVGDRVCVRPWNGDGFCGTVEAIRDTRYRIEVTSLVGCGRGCAPEAECSAGRSVGGGSRDAVVAGTSVWASAWCLTHTGIE
jgi:hypothetical protein